MLCRHTKVLRNTVAFNGAHDFGVLCVICYPPYLFAPQQGLHLCFHGRISDVGPGLIGFKSPGLEVAREVAQTLHHKVRKGPVI